MATTGVSEALEDPALALEDLDKVISLVEERQSTKPPAGVSVAGDTAEFLPLSFLDQGAQESRAVCRIARYFPLSTLRQEVIEEMQRSPLFGGPGSRDRSASRANDNLNTESALQDIFGIPEQLMPEIFQRDLSPFERLQNLFPEQFGQDYVAEVSRILKNLQDPRRIPDWHQLPSLSVEQLKRRLDIGEIVGAKIFGSAPTPLEKLKSITENQLAKLNPLPIGTGFLVGGNHLMTCNHVISDPAEAEQCVAQFNYVDDVQGYTQSVVEYEFDPAVLFVTEPTLDYTLVQLKSGMFTRQAGYQFGWIQLVERDDAIAPGLKVISLPSETNLAPELPAAEILQKLGVEGLATEAEFQAAYPGCTLAVKALQWKHRDQLALVARHPERLPHDLLDRLSTGLPEAIGKKLLSASAGDFVISIQHPKGQQKQISLNDRNQIKDDGLYKNFLRYSAPANYGSSGSPVFNKYWQLVALHHAAIAAPVDDSNSHKQDTRHSQPQILAHQGVRIDSILADLKQKSLTFSKLQSFIQDFVVTAEALNYPPLSSGALFNGIDSVVNTDGQLAFVSADAAGTLRGWSWQGVPLWQTRQSFQEPLNNVQIDQINLSPTAVAPLVTQGIAETNSHRFRFITAWSLTGEVIDTVRVNLSESLWISPDGQHVVKTQRTDTGQTQVEVQTLAGDTLLIHSGDFTVTAIAMDMFKRWFALAQTTGDKQVQVQLFRLGQQSSLASKKLLGGTLLTWQGTGQPIKTLQFSHLETSVERLAAASLDGTLRIWQLSQDPTQPKHTFTIPKASPKSGFAALCFDATADRLATVAEGEAAVKIWALDGTLQLTLAHAFPVSQVDFSTDGQRLLSTDEEGTVRLWNAQGQTVEELPQAGRWLQSNPEATAARSQASQPKLTVPEALTIEAWVKPQTGQGGTLLSNHSRIGGSAHGCEFRLEQVGSQLEMSFTRNGEQRRTRLAAASYEPAAGLPWNRFSHVAVTVQPTAVKFYLNGTLVSTQPGLASLPAPRADLGTQLPVLIGATWVRATATPHLDRVFAGIISELRVWQTARTQAQIKAHRDCRVEPSDQLIGYWRFEAGEGTQVHNLAEASPALGAGAGIQWVRSALPLPCGLALTGRAEIDCGTSPSFDLAQAVTVEAWVKHRFGNGLIVSRGDRDRGYSLAWRQGKLRVTLKNPELSDPIVEVETKA
ncbi:MAG: hypothetical protein F6J97_12410, partial [Leptolyngbya sp. SIO4C1]|nr:hypothetical protein [Leptolyngbya sp. SIO4C1]